MKAGPSPIRPNYRLIAGLSILGAVVSLVSIPLLTDRPDSGQEIASLPGGESVVKKTGDHPLTRGLTARIERSEPAQPAPQAAPEPVAPVEAAQPEQSAEVNVPALPPGVVLSGPGFTLSPPVAAPAPQTEAPAPAPAPSPQASPVAPEPAPPPMPARTPEPSTASAANTQESAPSGIRLPWETGDEASSGSNAERVANLPPDTAAANVTLPGRSEIRSWARSEAREFVGGVDADGMPLYRFDVWLDLPEAVRSQIRSVTYEYRAPSTKPPRQSSSEAGDGFRVKFGAAACAEKATITLQMADGRERSVDVDGCRILN